MLCCNVQLEVANELLIDSLYDKRGIKQIMSGDTERVKIININDDATLIRHAKIEGWESVFLALRKSLQARLIIFP